MLAAARETSEVTHTLHKVKDLRGEKIAARDGSIGQVDHVYFDDEDWRVRYFVVDKPVGRQYEEPYARYHGVSLYWVAPEEAGMPTVERSDRRARQLKEAERRASESHLRSSDEVIGYSIHAADGPIGHVDDVRVDDRNWAVSDLVVDTRGWLPGKKVLVPPSAVKDIDWSTRLGMRREDVERSCPAP